MASRRRCRRCGATLTEASAFCGTCGTRQYPGTTPTPMGPRISAVGGWYADPFDRQPLRYWDGEIWTEHVHGGESTRDVLSIDALAASRPPDGAWRASFGSMALSLLGLGIAFGLSYLFILPFLLLGHPGGILVGLSISEAGLWTGLFGTCVLTSRRYGTGNLRSDYRVNVRTLDLAVGFGASLVARCFASVVLIPFIHVLRSAGNPDRSLYAITGLGAAGWLVLVLLTCLGAPLFEELFFRGLLQGQLVEKFGPGLGIALTSVLFGAAHIANDPGVSGLLLALSVGASGIVLGTVRHFTGRLGSSMLTHAFFNAGAVIALAVAG